MPSSILQSAKITCCDSRAFRFLDLARIFHKNRSAYLPSGALLQVSKPNINGVLPMPKSTADGMEFGRPGRRVVEANFQSGAISSSGGVMLLHQVERRIS